MTEIKLTDLNPRWVQYGGQKLGIIFDCPHCRQIRLSVAFHHDFFEINRTFELDIEDRFILAVNPTTKIWTETNPEPDTFDNLTLTPSIDCSSSGHWHGFIADGLIR